MSHDCLWEHLEANLLRTCGECFGKPWEPTERHKLRKECNQDMRLCVMMYEYQTQHGRSFVHEHPYTTSNGEMQEIWKLMSGSRCALRGDQPVRARSSATVARTGGRRVFEVILGVTRFRKKLRKSLNALKFQDRDKGDLKLAMETDAK